jgi:hypothetical protein
MLPCRKTRQAGITIIFVKEEMTLSNPGRQSCDGIAIYIWCGRNATVSLQ